MTAEAGPEIRFVDTTFRDGSQSLWALGMRTGMIEAVAETMDRAGFAVVEVPIAAVNVKKFVRDLKENPWDMMRMVARRMPATVKGCMAGGHLMSFEAPAPRELVELYFKCVVDTGVLNRAQLTSNSFDQIARNFPWIIPYFRRLGLKIACALCYTISPRHTDAYYAAKMDDLVAFAPDVIYLKDQGGLLTVDRLRTLLPVMMERAGGVALELHSHCTTGLADLVYCEALSLGIRTVHTAVPPLAEGSSQPSVLTMARNARLLGYTPTVDEAALAGVAERLTAIARRDGLPIGAPLAYDVAQYIHHVPGGVISNLRHQLGQLGIQHRLDEVLDEAVRVRRDLGYPIMITPHSQFVVTQAAINVAKGERYRLVTDELIQFAQGVYGEDSGYTWMDQDLKDRFLGMARARELAACRRPDLSLKDIRAKIGGPGVSDEDFLMRYLMKGEQEIAAMHAAGRPRQYLDSTLPLATLLAELGKHRSVRGVHIRRGGDAVVLKQSEGQPA